MKRPNTQILSHAQIASLITFEGAIDTVQKVMEAHGRSQVIAPALLHADASGGEFHIKTGGILGDADSGVFGLRTLSAWGTAVTGEAAAQLRKKLPYCEVIGGY